jgi:hypothetical protein
LEALNERLECNAVTSISGKLKAEKNGWRNRMKQPTLITVVWHLGLPSGLPKVNAKSTGLKPSQVGQDRQTTDKGDADQYLSDY